MNAAVAESSASIVLAVDHVGPFSKVMAMKLGSTGRTVHVVDEIADFRAKVETDKPDVVVMDGEIEYAPELRQWLKSMPVERLTSLVAFYPQGSDPKNADGFRVLEDAYLIEPYEVSQLNDLIEAEVERLGKERKYFVSEVRFQMPSQSTYVQQGGDFLETLAKNSGLSEEDWMALVNAGREALDNGARHGNKNSVDLRLHVTYVLDRTKVTVTVEDEGPGFDAASHLGDGIEGDAVALARKRHSQGKVGGLGIMLMLRCVDNVEYNHKGNEVKLTKQLRKPSA